MPLIDMPIEELRRYQGRNECPADIDQYWDESLAEMEALGTSCELVKAAFQVPGYACYDLYFTGVGGARVHARFIRPDGSAPRPAVLMFHGYSGQADAFSSMMRFAGAGFCTFALSARGQGGQSEDITPVKGTTLRGHIIRGLDDPDPKKLLFRSIYLDTAQLARIAMAMDCVDAARVGATGGSQGGGLTMACAALTPTLNRAAPVYPFLCDYRRVWEMDLAVDAYEELRYYFRCFDPRHEREAEAFMRLGYIDNQHLAHRTRCKVMMFTGLMDKICPASTQFAAYNKLAGKKKMVVYPDFGHEWLPDCDDMIMEWMLRM